MTSPPDKQSKGDLNIPASAATAQKRPQRTRKKKGHTPQKEEGGVSAEGLSLPTASSAAKSEALSIKTIPPVSQKRTHAQCKISPQSSSNRPQTATDEALTSRLPPLTEARAEVITDNSPPSGVVTPPATASKAQGPISLPSHKVCSSMLPSGSG
ncbi:hypothetical protein BC629DRAFT_255017 [Irpex lacteus]|nr:hypothetical protein BC629DRAFT_255017 [Irpex lacteus]